MEILINVVENIQVNLFRRILCHLKTEFLFKEKNKDFFKNYSIYKVSALEVKIRSYKYFLRTMEIL